MTKPNIEAERFRSICDQVMQHSEGQIRAALTDWVRREPAGLPVVVTQVLADRGRTVVVSRAEIAEVLDNDDEDEHAVCVEVLSGPKDMIPVVLAFVEQGFSHCVWIQPVSASAN